MWKWFLRLMLLGIAGLIGISTYQSYEKGYFAIPDLPDGAYVFSFRHGMRGIVLDAEVSDPISDMPKFFRRLSHANPGRRYFAISFDVPRWFEKAWSICTVPTDQEHVETEQSIPVDLQRELVGARLDAVCRVESDGERILRGLLYSVPNP